jgi:hypothetical protein
MKQNVSSRFGESAFRDNSGHRLSPQLLGFPHSHPRTVVFRAKPTLWSRPGDQAGQPRPAFARKVERKPTRRMVHPKHIAGAKRHRLARRFLQSPACEEFSVVEGPRTTWQSPGPFLCPFPASTSEFWDAERVEPTRVPKRLP